MEIDWESFSDTPGVCLQSVRNEVCRILLPDGSVIRKRYSRNEGYLYEMRQLAKLKEKRVNVPDILHHAQGIAFLEDLGDTTYVDVLCRIDMQDENAVEKPANALMQFLFSYYAATGSLRGDVNLRNFLYTGGVCYGVDFEEPSAQGPWESDIGRLLAYVLTYDPAFDARFAAFAHSLWRQSLARGLCAESMWQHMTAEFEQMKSRRAAFDRVYEKALQFAPDWEGLHAHGA